MRIATVSALLLLLSSTAAADVLIKNFTHTVTNADVTYQVEACSVGTASPTAVGIYVNLSAKPSVGQKPDITTGVTPTPAPICPKIKLIRKGLAIGLYNSYAKIDPLDLLPVGTDIKSNNVLGPRQVCVGPDLVISKFALDMSGASVTYKATVCNNGSMSATKFRVGFWHDSASSPPSTQMGDIFQGVAQLAPGKCKDLVVSGGRRPNGSYTAWARADSGDFVKECRETNNPSGPLKYTMANPDLVVTSFSAQVSGGAVTYSVRVCNKGVVKVDKFYCDIYYHRPKKAPTKGEPGDQVKSISGLLPSACTNLTFQRSGAPDFTYSSYVQVDADDFVSEPNETNNLSEVLQVVVGTGGTSSGSCVDNDKDGYGVGSGCTTRADCNDKNATINPGAKEVCGDKLDQDCDLTPDDGCPGVKCTDSDGDGFGTGADCKLADCDDSNKAVHPGAKESCGNGKDDNCNRIVDDGCATVNCVDNDMDGYGVGSGCRGVPDCNDSNFTISPGAKEICGDKVDQDCDLTPDDGCVGVACTDNDGDGFGVGKDCVLADCDDNNKAVYPWAPETCGDNKDDNCNKIADDGCNGRQCVDRDADGYGVGAGCPGPQDCDDKSRTTNPKAAEKCGDGLDNDCDGVADDGCKGTVDNDGDGVGVGGVSGGQPDCNDKDASVKPDQKETCGDGIDNDCDGTVDDGGPGVKCVDGDGDGWGVGVACKLADCNDKSGSIHPYAAEICGDNIDNNCNLQVDEGCAGVQCKDKDLDGFGVGGDCCLHDKTGTCIQDCDDNDGGTNPWVDEICADGKDNDCDKQKDEGCVLCTDRDSDNYGIGPQCSNWDCDETDPAAHPGAPEVCNGKDTNCNGIVDDNCAGGEGGCAVPPASGGGSAPLAAVWLLLGLMLLGAARRR